MSASLFKERRQLAVEIEVIYELARQGQRARRNAHKDHVPPEGHRARALDKVRDWLRREFEL